MASSDDGAFRDSDDLVVIESNTIGEHNSYCPLNNSNLSVEAPEFVPGKKWSPPPSPILDVHSELATELRTSDCSNKINVNLKGKTGITEDDPSTFILNDSSKGDRASDDGGWKTAAKPHRRKRPERNVGREHRGNLQQSNRDRTGEQLPGEYVTVDSCSRYVVWSSDVDLARRSISQDRFVLIIMRGVPGSGKTTLAKSLQSNGVICSADEYFTHEGKYAFDTSRLSDAHTWCLQRTLQAVTMRLTPVIVDNTNVQCWQMSKYVKVAVRNSYDIYFVEPDTPWKRDAHECYKRNTHGLSLEAIEIMMQTFEPVIGLRSFLESGHLRKSIAPKPVTTSIEIDQTKSSVEQSASASSSISEIFEKIKEDEVAAANCVWESSEQSSAWLNEELAKASSLPPRLPDLPTNDASFSTAPKEQRVLHQSPESKTPELKKSDVSSGRKKRLGVLDVTSLKSFTRGPWQLPDDLAGGLSTSASGIENSSGATNSKPAPSTVEVRVRDSGVQVTEKHLALACLSHRRLTRCSVDDCEFDFDERAVIMPTNEDRLIIKCDRSVQCEYDTSAMISADEGGYARALSTLRSCFPQVDSEDIEEIFKNCNFQLEWAVNVLLDSGYDVDWSTQKRISEEQTKTEANNTVLSADTGEVTEEYDTSESLAQENVRIIDTTSMNEPFCASTDSKPLCVSEESDDGECPLYSMELSVDMAAELQRIFSPVFPDVPPDILSPTQLKIRIPHHVAAELYRYWLEAQTQDKVAEIDSDFFSEESLSEEFAPESRSGKSNDRAGRSLGKDCAGVTGDDDLLAVERQIWMDEQLARQLASEEDHNADTELEAPPSRTSVNSMASKIKLKRLYELFPSVDRQLVTSVFNSSNCHLDKTIDTLCNTFNMPKAAATSSPQMDYQSDTSAVARRYETGGPSELEQLSYEQLRHEAFMHHEQRQLNFQKAQEYHRKGMASVAYYYAQRGHVHSKKFKEANEQAAKRILQQRKIANPAGVLDLHGLHVAESIHALVDTLREYENRPGKEIKIITGRGIHSSSGPKIKPAVTNYLRQRGYSFTELSPGVLVVTIKR